MKYKTPFTVKSHIEAIRIAHKLMRNYPIIVEVDITYANGDYATVYIRLQSEERILISKSGSMQKMITWMQCLYENNCSSLPEIVNMETFSERHSNE